MTRFLGHKLFSIVVFLIVGIWGFAPLDKMRLLYPVYGINYGDILFVLILMCWFFVGVVRNSFKIARPEKRFRFFIYLVLAFSLWMLVSCWINLLTGMYSSILDLLGVLRLFYYTIVIFFLAVWVRQNGYDKLLSAFCIGVLGSAAFNLFRQFESTDLMLIAGLPQLQERNFSGAMFAVTILFSGLLLFKKKSVRAVSFTGAALFFAAFTFSKGSWIMCGFAMLAFIIILHHTVFRRKGEHLIIKAVIVVMLLFSIVAVYGERERIGAIAMTKASTIQGDVQDGLYDSARIGHILSSIVIALAHPLFGVGESNWQDENEKNKEWLGSLYLENDNPHSALMMILSAYGFPAFVLFLGLFVLPHFVLFNTMSLPVRSRLIVVTLFGIVFFINANLMLQIYTQYFFWLFCGVVYGNHWHFMQYSEKYYENIV